MTRSYLPNNSKWKTETNAEISYENLRQDDYRNKSFSLAVIRRLLRTLRDHQTQGINRTNFASKSGLNYGTCIRYLDLLLLLRWVIISPVRVDLVFLTETGEEFMFLLEQTGTMPMKGRGKKYLDPVTNPPRSRLESANGENNSILEMHRLSNSSTVPVPLELHPKSQENPRN